TRKSAPGVRAGGRLRCGCSRIPAEVRRPANRRRSFGRTTYLGDRLDLSNRPADVRRLTTAGTDSVAARTMIYPEGGEAQSKPFAPGPRPAVPHDRIFRVVASRLPASPG